MTTIDPAPALEPEAIRAQFPALARVHRGQPVAYFDEPVEKYVRRRHGELQKAGLANPAIYQQIAAELTWWRVAAPRLSERQIRRVIYG